MVKKWGQRIYLAAVLVPTDRFYVAGFYGDDWGSDLPHHIMSQMLSLISIAS